MLQQCFFATTNLPQKEMDTSKYLERLDEENNLGRWTEQENLKYIVFLHKNKAKFACRLKKRYFSL